MKDYYIDYRDLTTELDEDGCDIYEEGMKIIQANSEWEARRKFMDYAWDNLHFHRVEILSCEVY